MIRISSLGVIKLNTPTWSMTQITKSRMHPHKATGCPVRWISPCNTSSFPAAPPPPSDTHLAAAFIQKEEGNSVCKWHERRQSQAHLALVFTYLQHLCAETTQKPL